MTAGTKKNNLWKEIKEPVISKSFTNTMIIIIIIVSLVDVNFDHIDFEIVPLMDGHIVCQ